MDNIPSGHKIIDMVDHIWPWITGLFALIIGSFKLWWADRRQIKNETADLRKVVLWLKDNTVTHQQLHECREEVRHVDEDNLRLMFSEIKEHNEKNAQQHEEIKKEVRSEIRGVMNKIIDLYSSDKNNKVR